MSSLTAPARKLLRQLLRSRGYDITRHIASNGEPLPLLSLVIHYIVLLEGYGAVVEIGANEGVMKDPVRDSIVSLGLPALLVEPLPNTFTRLQANYHDRPNIRFENAAVSDQRGEAEIFRINPAATGLPPWVHGLASFDRSVLVKHASAEGVNRTRFLESIEAARVPVLTMAELLDKHPEFRRPLVLQIDTEGHDFKVVRSTVAAKCLPRLINYEHKHLPYHDQVACRELLASLGYSFWSGKTDTLAMKVSGLLETRIPERQSAPRVSSIVS